jgi:aspartokinase/homoserine dehydrogenase 1
MRCFFLSDVKTVHLFVVGVGLIGSTLIDQIMLHSEDLLKDHKLRINIIGMANSKKNAF